MNHTIHFVFRDINSGMYLYVELLTPRVYHIWRFLFDNSPNYEIYDYYFSYEWHYYITD